MSVALFVIESGALQKIDLRFGSAQGAQETCCFGGEVVHHVHSTPPWAFGLELGALS